MSIGNQEQLQRYAQPTRSDSGKQDIDYPFSFQDWSGIYKNIIPGQEYTLYNQYLVDWYKNKATTSVDKKLQIKLNYLKLLRQLHLFFKEEELELWYEEINLNNEKELLLAIPYFAKKLKDIALYYLNLREDIKKSKIKYNLTGTGTGINLELQEFLLTNYTKKLNAYIAIPASIWRSVPELSAIQDTINIQIEELYDTFQYLDHSPTQPVSAYYDLNFSALEDYFNSLGLALTSTDWIFKTGVFEVSGNQIVDSIKVSEELTNKYLNNNKFTSFLYTASAEADVYNVSITEGNNFFYWPFGAYESNISDLPRYSPIPLSAAGLEDIATGGTSLEFADTIFIKSAQGIKGAWLRYVPFDVSYPTMQATLYANKTTKFRFPFPGFGLSAEDLDWTGYELVTNPLFVYQPNTVKKAIENVYWSTVIDLTSHEPVELNSTTLVRNKAYASEQFNFADKIRTWDVLPQYIEGAYTGTANEAWLYKMTQTDISIAPGNDSTILWPYGSLDRTRNYPNLPEFFANACLPTNLTDIQFNHAIASNQLSGADMILKISNYQDSRPLATEAAWLSASTTYYPETRIEVTKQPSLNCIFTPGNYTQFVWQGEDGTSTNSVFASINHQSDCVFATTPNTTYKDYNLCTCQQVLFTPFGHPGNEFTDFAGYSDFIIEDPFNFSLDLSEWRDREGLPYTESDSFAWFKTNTKVGFGDGQWLTGSGQEGLSLRTGRSYLYYRQILRDENATTNIFPEYCVRYSYNNFNSNNFKWIQATKDINGEWINADTPSSLVLYSGENLLYSRVTGATFTSAKSGLKTEVISENRGSIWSNYDYLTVSDGYNTSTNSTVPQQFTLNYPQSFTLNTNTQNQEPLVSVTRDNFVEVFSWQVTYPNGTVYTLNSQSLSIIPSLTGLYTFKVTVVSAATIPPSAVFSPRDNTFYYTNTGYYTFNNIPAVTAISGTSIVYPVTSFLTPAPGFVLNTPLYGWDYNTSTFTSNTLFGNFGARPFWATTANIKNIYTGFKGINSWGNYLRLVDGYNVISQPEISNLTLNTGVYVEYERNANTDITWSESLVQSTVVDKNVWSTLNFNTTAITNLNTILNNNAVELIVTPITAATPLQLESIIDNEPVQIYYNAVNPFVWSITATPIITKTNYNIVSGEQITNIKQPWANLPTRFYPNAAILPTVQNLSSISDFGGFFVPQNLGASQYINKDFTTNIILSSPALTGIYEDGSTYIGGRGLTKEDQLTPFQITIENNTWLKEPPISGPIAGNIKKNIFKKYQKFIPYQTRYETNPRYRYGITTPASRQTPWGGPTDTDWTDLQNYPVSYTGELNIDNWTDTQILKQSRLQLDNWVTDIFGNQYGLYKSLSSVQPKDRKNTTGNIWVRKNSQKTEPAFLALSGVFDTYKNISLYNELTGNGIKQIDVFFDTLYIQTTGAIIFERLIYEFETDKILSLADEFRSISLALPVTPSLSREISGVSLSSYTFAKAGETWFLPERKNVIQSVCGLSGMLIIPELYKYNLNSLILEKVFPIEQEDVITIRALSSLNLQDIKSPLLTHNSLKKEYTIIVQGIDQNSLDVIIEIIINDYPILKLKNITVYNTTTASVQQQLLPPVINQSLVSTLSFVTPLSVDINIQNGPATFIGTSLPSWALLTTTGTLTGIIPSPGIYNLPFVVNNSIGPAYYTYTVNAL